VREDAPRVALVHALPLGWPVRGEPELAGGGAEGERRRERDWVRFSARVELNWKVEKLVGWSDGAMQGWGGWSARARSRRPWRSGGRRKKEEKRGDGGVLGVLIGQGAPERGE